METVIVINTEPKKETHICFYVTRLASRRAGEIQLIEVYEATYAHPQAPEDANIQVTETRLVDRANPISYKAATWLLLEAAQKAVQAAQLFKSRYGEG